MNPLVSVIVPAFNVAPYIYHCLSSIAGQTYRDLEIIVVNDGSTDDTLSICMGFASFDSRVLIINQSNSGLVSARKAGLSASSGHYIFNVDGDDWIPTDAIATLVDAALVEDCEVVVAGFYREFIGSLIAIPPLLDQRFYSKADIESIILPSLVYDYHVCNHGISTYSWGKLFSANLYRKIISMVPNDIALGEDSLCTYPFIACCSGLQVIHNCVYFYRQRSSSMLKSCLSSSDELIYLGYFINVLRTTLSRVSSFDFTRQISAYYLRLASERTALCFNGDSIDKRLVDNKLFDKDSKISVYSSGTFGRRLYSTLPNHGYNIASLYDVDYHESLIGQINVLSPAKLMSSDFDFLFVAAWTSTSIDSALSAIYKHKPTLSPGSLIKITRLDQDDISVLYSEFSSLLS